MGVKEMMLLLYLVFGIAFIGFVVIPKFSILLLLFMFYIWTLCAIEYYNEDI